MAKDGRLDIRFAALLPEIEREAKRDEMQPGPWVRKQIRRVIRKRKQRSAATVTAK